MDKALIIFAKNLEEGTVKTRLAKDIGPVNALIVYKHIVDHTRKITSEVDADRLLFYSSFIPESDEWPASDFETHLQIGDNLGLRMLNAFNLAFSRGYRHVIIIGSDCLELTGSLMSTAFDRLNDHDFVIGPANDGGYYLLGMNSPHEALFRNKEWSTSSVFPQTVAQINDLSDTVHILPELNDIDTIDDINQELLSMLISR